MQIAEVVGNVVATQKVYQLDGTKLMLVQARELDGRLTGSHKVAVDCVGAGIGEVVFLVEGSSARLAQSEDGKSPIDCAIIGIIDSIEANGKIIFKKKI
ncbi:MAG TPA: EutN/CcmL family microcompartment protein [bacterium]|nr:EutN/CcmL family microcompartment protein [bacterium]